MALNNWLGSIRRFLASTLSAPQKWLIDWVRGDDDGEGGIVVNGKTGMEYAPIWYGINKIAGNVGMLPLSAYEQVKPRQREERTAHPGSWVVNHPNEFMDKLVFFETITQHALGWGNGRAAIERNGRNDPANLIPLLPDRTVTVLMNGVKYHVTTDLETGERTKIPDKDVLHICGFSFDGIQGYSLWDKARRSISAGLNAEQHTSNYFKNDARPGLILEAPAGILTKESEAKEFLKNWNDYHQGVNKSNRAALLRAGIKANTVDSMSGSDGQWVEQRKFQRQEAALWLLLEQILGDDSSVSYNSLEQKNLAYLSSCLNRWLIKWEEQCNRKLLTTPQYNSGRWYFKFNRNALLQTTTKERFDIYSIGRQIGMYSPNDCRVMEDEPPRTDPGGDSYDNPNTTAGGQANDPAKAPEPKPDPQPKPPTRAEIIEEFKAIAREVAGVLPQPQTTVVVPEQPPAAVTVNLPEAPAPNVEVKVEPAQVTNNFSPEFNPTFSPENKITNTSLILRAIDASPDKVRALLKGHIIHRLGILQATESKQVYDGANRKPPSKGALAGKMTLKPFGEWVADFYSAAVFLPRIEEAFADIGGTPAMAQEYADISRERLLEITAGGDAFAGAVQAETAKWHVRIEEIAERHSKELVK